MTENLRAALAQSYFATGMAARAEELFQCWLAADPGWCWCWCWCWCWIGWADCYGGAREVRDYARAEELLRRGYDVAGGRDRGYRLPRSGRTEGRHYQMTDFPQLAYLARAYFHQDYDLEAPTAARVIGNYIADEPPDAIRELATEIETMLDSEMTESQISDLWITTWHAFLGSDRGRAQLPRLADCNTERA